MTSRSLICLLENQNGGKLQKIILCTIIQGVSKFRIQSVVGKDTVELEKYLEKKISLSEENISTLILYNR
jgi:helix-turn-helix protein